MDPPFTWACPLCLSLKPTLLIYLPKLSSLMGHSPCPTLVLHLWGHLALNLLLLLPTPYPVFLHNLFPLLFIYAPFTTHSYHSRYHTIHNTTSLSSHVPIKHTLPHLHHISSLIIIIFSQPTYGYNTPQEQHCTLQTNQQINNHFLVFFYSLVE